MVHSVDYSAHQRQGQYPVTGVDQHVGPRLPFKKPVGDHHRHHHQQAEECSVECSVFEGIESAFLVEAAVVEVEQEKGEDKGKHQRDAEDHAHVAAFEIVVGKAQRLHPGFAKHSFVIPYKTHDHGDQRGNDHR